MDFLYKAIAYFGYKPAIIQTDNGSEFTHIKRTNRKHTLDNTFEKLNIKHQKIRPRTPRHNGRIECSHRNDQEGFYNHMLFYNYEGLKVQIKQYRNRSNNITMQVLGWKSPLEKRLELER